MTTTTFADTTTTTWDDALEAIERGYELGWSDGLPVAPPTVARVAEFIGGAGRAPEEIIGELPERRRVITVEKAAANAVMAGCRPEYFPVILAAAEAMLDPVFNLVGPSSSMGGAAVLVIVNGPVAGQIGLNSRNNLFGPGNRANGTIGRAIRLILMNACAAIPGLFDRSVIGHPGKYTYCIAEAEGETHWTPLHIERGFAPGDSAVTVFAGESPRQIRAVGAARGHSLCDGGCGFVAGDINVHIRLGGRCVGGHPAGADCGYFCGQQPAVGGVDEGSYSRVSAR